MMNSPRALWLLLAALVVLVSITLAKDHGSWDHDNYNNGYKGRRHDKHGSGSHEYDDDDDDDHDGKRHHKALVVVAIVAIALAVGVAVLLAVVCVLKKKNRRAAAVHDSFVVMPHTAGTLPEKNKLPEGVVSTGALPHKEGSPYVVGPVTPPAYNQLNSSNLPSAPGQDQIYYPPSYSSINLQNEVRASEGGITPVGKA